MIERISLWECLYETKKITKPIRLIECFAGIGAQYKALKKLTNNVESYKIVEWAFNSIIAYNNIHIKDKTDYAKDLSKEEILDRINGISINYNEPLTKEQLLKKPMEWLKKAYNNIVATHNLVNIMQTKGKDLEIVDKDKYEYILTYSFPCQDLSLAGLGKGMDLSQNEGGTRSGLLWEIKRILEELKETNQLPQILLMENVPMLISKNHIHNFKKWEIFLNKLGYKNYTECLNAKDYGIPQNRNRVFMVSILGDYNYTFPRKEKLKLKLKDLLEDEVDEKYYLNDKQIEDIKHWNAYEKPLETLEKTDKNNYSPTLTTRSGAYAAGMILVKNATQKGYLEAQVGDGVDISSRMQKHRGTVQKNSSQTLTTKGGNDVGVVVKQTETYIQWKEKDKLDVDCRACCENKIDPTTTPKTKVLLNNLRIRKLTPKECCRLMGFEDSDYEAMKQDLSDMAIYHCCGDSIVVNVLEKIFGQMIEKNENTVV